MSAPRSPGYPSITLGEAIEIVSKLYDANRGNPTDREAAAKDMGYSGLTGTSAKMLADLVHFGLVEKAGKGGVRVSQTAVDILYPASPAGKAAALRQAAANPSLFAALHQHFSDGPPSVNSLRAYLMRKGFASAAVPPIIKSFTETMRLIQEEAASESHGTPPAEAPHRDLSGQATQTDKALPAVVTPPSSAGGQKPQEVPVLSGERVIFVDEAGPGQYLKVIASGDLDEALLEALEDFTKRRKKRLMRAIRVLDDELEETSTLGPPYRAEE